MTVKVKLGLILIVPLVEPECEMIVPGDMEHFYNVVTSNGSVEGKRWNHLWQLELNYNDIES